MYANVMIDQPIEVEFYLIILQTEYVMDTKAIIQCFAVIKQIGVSTNQQYQINYTSTSYKCCSTHIINTCSNVSMYITNVHKVIKSQLIICFFMRITISKY